MAIAGSSAFAAAAKSSWSIRARPAVSAVCATEGKSGARAGLTLPPAAHAGDEAGGPDQPALIKAGLAPRPAVGVKCVERTVGEATAVVGFIIPTGGQADAVDSIRQGDHPRFPIGIRNQAAVAQGHDHELNPPARFAL